MTSRPEWTTLLGVVFLCGCQSLDSLVPWQTADKAGYTADELAAFDAQPIQPMSMTGTVQDSASGPAPLATNADIVQASYNANSSATPVDAQTVQQLVSDGQAIIARTQSDPVALQNAKSYFEQAIALDQRNASAHHGMAIVADLTKDYPTAEWHYKQALSGSPNNPDLLNDVGYSYILQHRFAEATDYLNRAVQVAPGHEQATLNMALMALKRGNRPDAQRILAGTYPPERLADTLNQLEERARLTEPTPNPRSENSGAGVADSNAAAQNVLQRVQQERERVNAERTLAATAAEAEVPIHVYPPGVDVARNPSLAASDVTASYPPLPTNQNPEPQVITLPGGRQYQIIPQNGQGAAPPSTQQFAMTSGARGMAYHPPGGVPVYQGNGFPDAGGPIIRSAQDYRHQQHSAQLPTHPIGQYQYSRAQASGNRSTPVAGLNAGPGVLFPVASMQRQPQTATQKQIINSAPAAPPYAQAPMLEQTYPSQQHPSQTYPSQTYPSQTYPSQQHPGQQHPVQQFPQQQSSYPGPALNSQQSNPANAAQLQTGVPASNMNPAANAYPYPAQAPAPGDALAAYERQLQQLDDKYNQDLQQLNGRQLGISPSVSPVPAQY